MSIVSGYKKFKKYILTSSGFQLVSHWTKANTLEFDDGKTAQDKLGAIDGISSSRESNSDKIAASTALVSELNSDLGGLSFFEDSTGKYVVGADSVPKKLGSMQGEAVYTNATTTSKRGINTSFSYICSDFGLYMIIVSMGGRTSSASGSVSVSGVSNTIIYNGTSNDYSEHIFTTLHTSYCEAEKGTKISISVYSDNGNWSSDTGVGARVCIYKLL